ncbi:protein kinase family protein [Rhizobium laguerreae]|uniref:protein kinase domain-containing protein n=1 Tax=Rhizobium laguerreae TaxID=1076926 RepID=UPI001C91AD00|nr:hypothetical protein [Rhizobium laguerreae]MBY3307516.1 protein kinase family protein [Rhizobium laguerreae]
MATRGWALLRALLRGARHLHRNGIVHRDIKPQNIFLDHDVDDFVIGDLGIAHFNAARFPREAETQKKERMANFALSALNWYLRGCIVRGDGRPAYSESDAELALLDAIITKCIQDDPTRRFQDMNEISAFEQLRRNPPRDVFRKLYDLDDSFRSSIRRYAKSAKFPIRSPSTGSSATSPESAGWTSSGT